MCRFDRLKDVSSHFEEIRYDSFKKQLFIHISALGYHARMFLKLKFAGGVKEKIINWEAIGMEESAGRRTILWLFADYSTEKLPLPKVLMGIGFEIIAKRVAGLMRVYLEESYRKIIK